MKQQGKQKNAKKIMMLVKQFRPVMDGIKPERVRYAVIRPVVKQHILAELAGFMN